MGDALSTDSAHPDSKSDGFSCGLLTYSPGVKEYEYADNCSEFVLQQSLLSSVSVPCHRCSYASCTLCDFALSDGSRVTDLNGKGRRPSEKPPFPAFGWTSELFSNDILKRLLVQTDVYHHTTEQLIFILQLP